MEAPRNVKYISCLESDASHLSSLLPEPPTISYPKQMIPVQTYESASSSVNSFPYDLSDSDAPSSPATDLSLDETSASVRNKETAIGSSISTQEGPVSEPPPLSATQVLRPLAVIGAETKEVEKVCCGGGCCLWQDVSKNSRATTAVPVKPPDNDAYRSLNIGLGSLGIDTALNKISDLPEKTVSFHELPPQSSSQTSTKETKVPKHPPSFVTPHPPYDVFSARVHHARELTKPGAEKRTYHFDLDVTDYPMESGEVDFIVGGAIGIQAPNSQAIVDETFNLLCIPTYLRDKRVTVNTTGGRWPTIWGEDQPRSLVTTRRELLTWCSDLQSHPPTKQLFRLLAEHASMANERQILLYLASAQGQAAFCNLRTNQHITIPHLLTAFSSSQPPMSHLLSTLQPLMPRFYSLSQDPQLSCTRIPGGDGQTVCRRLVEIAVTIHDSPYYRGGLRTGVGSGFLERTARKVIDAEKAGIEPTTLDLRIPMFRGLMANPLAREFVTDGPMLLIGAGVGIAPFRGFVQRRLRSASCANKVWVLQGVRDSLLDELYSGEWGIEEERVKKVVESRRGKGRYVQEEVRHQADLVWYVINSLDGRVFVCGSGKGMGEGVERALVDVVMDKAGVRREEAEGFWEGKKAAGQYIVVSLIALLRAKSITDMQQETW